VRAKAKALEDIDPGTGAGCRFVRAFTTCDDVT